MIRPRAAITLVLFMLIGIVTNTPHVFNYEVLLGILSIVSAYVTATSVNDLADWQIDRINLHGHLDRPLISGEADQDQLTKLAIVSACVALACSAFIGSQAIAIVVMELMLNLFYSLKPFRISYRPLITPFYLPFAYVVLPYLLGVVIVNASFDRTDAVLVFALYCLFVARIILKDFRDVKGDKQHGKLTFLLRFGKTTTCLMSIGSFVVGGIALGYYYRNTSVAWIGMVPFLIGVPITHLRLYNARKIDDEIAWISLGARAGNGLLFIVLGTALITHGQQNYFDDLLLFYTSLTIIFSLYFLAFWEQSKNKLLRQTLLKPVR